MQILCAIDLSPVSSEMIGIIRKIPWNDDLRVFLLHCADPEPAFIGWKAGPKVVRDQVVARFQREHRELEAMAQGLRDEGIDATALIIQGPAVEKTLHKVSELNIDVLVVGSHGHGAAYDLLVGSVSAGLIRQCPVPVLVVPSRGGSASGPTADRT